MITGDKLGTAENIARATRLITRDMTVVHLADGSLPNLLNFSVVCVSAFC